MKLKKYIPAVLSAVLLASAFAVCALYGNEAQPAVQTMSVQTADSAEKSDTADNMNGVWVTYLELSMEREADKSEKAFAKKFSAIADNCINSGFNTLIVQVRPFCDALYKSKYYPYSHILTGTQGKNPGYDPLKTMCKICREKGLAIHAWINPYRVTYNNVPVKLSDDNPYTKDKSIGIKTETTLILDPSCEKARKLIADGIAEIVKNYDVDGIQFDDYFYPVDIENLDSKQYGEYRSSAKGEIMGLDDWRKANVNLLITQCWSAVHKNSKNKVFGISPQGNLENNAELFADVKSWCGQRGYIDYICPQIYFSLENPALGFEDALNDWLKLDFAKGVKLYVGLAGYKAGTDDDEGTWEYYDDTLFKEYKILKKNNNISGFMLYSYSSLIDEAAEKEIKNLKKLLILSSNKRIKTGISR